jgi:hypothetical protein
MWTTPTKLTCLIRKTITHLLQAFVSFDQSLTALEEQITTLGNIDSPQPVTTSHWVRTLYTAPNA